MSWRTPTLNDLQNCLLADELTKLGSTSAPANKAIAADAITEAVEYFRTAIRSGGKVNMGRDTMLPEGCIGKAMSCAAFNFLTRVGSIKVSAERTKRFDKAEEFWEKIRTGDVLFVDDALTEQSAPAIQQPLSRTRRFNLSRKMQRGI